MTKRTTKNTSITLGQDALNSARIRTIRAEALGEPKPSHTVMTSRCPTCSHYANDPWRWTLGGVITEGCIDAHHTGALVPHSQDAHWHNRMSARILRAGVLESLGAEPFTTRKAG